MRPLKIKDRCTKKKIKKCEEVIKTYDNIQTAYAELLDKDEAIKSIQCNVPLEPIEEGEFTTDFLCTKVDGDLMVRECAFRKKLSLHSALLCLKMVSSDSQLNKAIAP